jgi:hypothetical protein
MRKWWVVWPLYAGLMGFALGASFFFGLYGRNVTESSIAAQHEQHPTNETAKPKKEESDEALAYYTLWLMAFTGVLAFATVGLGIATAFLYVTGEKQFRFAIRASVKQSRDMQASVKVAQDSANAAKRSAEVADRLLVMTDRPWVALKIEIIEGLKFDPSLGCMIKVKLTLLNIGRSPAIGLGYSIGLHPSIERAVKSHQAMIESSRIMVKGMTFGHTRFPNDPIEREISLFVTQSDIEAGIKECDSGLVEPYIVACVYYGLPIGGRFRYTSTNRAIWLNDDTPGFAPAGYYSLDKISLSSFDGGETT